MCLKFRMGKPCGNFRQRLRDQIGPIWSRDGRVIDSKRANLIVGLRLIFFPPVTPNQ